MIGIKVKKSQKPGKFKSLIREEGRQVVIKHALGGAASVYEAYPVGPPHTDGTLHTRDTFQVLVNGVVIASKGNFWNTSALGHKTIGETFVVAFRAAGAAFFVEWGTIYMEARPILRTMVKMARFAISKELRALNLGK